jgi:hypothetical protein
MIRNHGARDDPDLVHGAQLFLALSGVFYWAYLFAEFFVTKRPEKRAVR